MSDSTVTATAPLALRLEDRRRLGDRFPARVRSPTAAPAPLWAALAALLVAVLAAVPAAAGVEAGAPASAAESRAALDGGQRVEATAADEGLDAVYRRFSAAYRELDPEAVAALYTPDALYLSGGGSEIRRGREAIAEGFHRFFDGVRDEGGRLEISFRIVERQVAGELGFDVGYYRLVRHRADGESSEHAGKFCVVAERDAAGVWRFRVDGFSDAPVEAFAAAAGRALP
jgi:uncharacterized protein (TIGR02246 family)